MASYEQIVKFEGEKPAGVVRLVDAQGMAAFGEAQRFGGRAEDTERHSRVSAELNETFQAGLRALCVASVPLRTAGGVVRVRRALCNLEGCM